VFFRERKEKMLDPVDFVNDHPEMTDDTRNLLLLVSILSLIIMVIWSIVKSIRNPRIGEGVNETMESRRRQWREEDIRLGNEIYDDEEERSAE
jgi:hypothetical protein